MESIANLRWFGHVKRRDETENITEVARIKMEGKLPSGRPRLRLRWKDSQKGHEAGNSSEEWATDRKAWKYVFKTRTDPACQ